MGMMFDEVADEVVKDEDYKPLPKCSNCWSRGWVFTADNDTAPCEVCSLEEQSMDMERDIDRVVARIRDRDVDRYWGGDSVSEREYELERELEKVSRNLSEIRHAIDALREAQDEYDVAHKAYICALTSIKKPDDYDDIKGNEIDAKAKLMARALTVQIVEEVYQ